MDFRNDTTTVASGIASGGSDGCINFNDPTNKGLVECSTKFGLPALYATHCDLVSLADFLVIASEALMARSHESYDASNVFASGTVARTFRSKFRWGRETVDTCPDNVDLVPKVEDGCAGIQDVFHDHIFVKESNGMTWRYFTAL